MNFKKISGAAKPEINITPLLDAVFILLIFFAVSTSFVYIGSIKVDLPEATTATEAEKDVVKVSVSKDNLIYVDGNAVQQSALYDTLKNAVTESPRASLVIEADRGSLHGIVVKVIDEGKKAGFVRFAIATEEPLK